MLFKKVSWYSKKASWIHKQASWCSKKDFLVFKEKKASRCSKQVFWYLANTDELSVKLSHEHTNYLWVNFEEAFDQLTFEQEINLLRSAKDFIDNN